MIDKTNEPPNKGSNNNQVDSDLGHDDLDSEINLDEDYDLNQDPLLDDDLSLEDDDLLLNDEIDSLDDASPYESEQYPEYGEQGQESFLDFIKNYGVLIGVFLIIGYFGYQYSFSTLSTDTQTGKEADQQVNAEQPGLNTSDVKPQIPDLTTPIDLQDNIDSATAIDMPKDENKPSGVPSTVDQEIDNQLNALKQQREAADLANIPQQAGNQDIGRISEYNAQKADALSKQNQELTNINNDLSQQIAKLTATVDSISRKVDERISSDSAKMAEVKNQVNNLNQQTTQLIDYIQNAGKAVGLLAAQAKKQEAILSSLGATYRNGSSLNAAGSGLKVDAVIAGRAWLTNNKGESFTVKIGDEIAGSGKVVTIDSNKNIITTDQGKVFD